MPRFAHTYGEPDCSGQGCGSTSGYGQPYANGSVPAQMLPPREITEPQFPPSKNATVDEQDDSAGQNLLDGFGHAPKTSDDTRSSLNRPASRPSQPRSVFCVIQVEQQVIAEMQ